MELAADFSFQPIPPIEDPETFAAPAAGEAPVAFEPAADPLGPLAGLAGRWTGEGFNVIWRPHHPSDGQLVGDHFLELNRTVEQLDFEKIPGTIPNRGLLQDDIPLHGLRYLQQISDANVLDAHGNNKGQHLEPGLWVVVPETSDPHEPQTVARLASIPHGTTILAQGTGQTSPGPPSIPKASIQPFPIGQHTNKQDLLEQHLNERSRFRTPRRPGLRGITQRMVNNPNRFLTNPPSAIVPGSAPSTVTSAVAATTMLQVSTHDRSLPGGGAANIAFLKGRGDGPNAVTSRVTATFWLQSFESVSESPRLQYSQLVLLDFNGLSWPHVTVATLRKAG
jgi:hypothetical protein